MSKQARYQTIASALLVLALVIAALFQVAAIPVFSWAVRGQYLEGLARFLVGGLSTLLVIFFLFPVIGQREYTATVRKLHQMLTLDPLPSESAIRVIQEQDRHLRWLAWRLSGRNLLLAFFGGVIAAAVADWWGGSPLTVACFLGLGWGGAVGLAAGVWHELYPPPLEEEGPIPGIPPLSDLDGSRQEHRQRLRDLGIATAEDLLHVAATPEGRAQLADQLGVRPPLIEQFAIEAELLRSIAGLNEEYAGLLYRVDVKGIADLARRDPTRLYPLLRDRFSDVVEYLEEPPSVEMVRNWVRQATKAESMIKF
jgi:hypothetical protein